MPSAARPAGPLARGGRDSLRPRVLLRVYDLVIVTKIGARRGEDGSWIPAPSPEELTRGVHDNLRNLRLDVLDVVNLRSTLSIHEPGSRGRSRLRSRSSSSSSDRVWCAISG
jgi:hypothetical protein